ncbi:MAG: helix-turn-helix transcriptional regulator [Candidatus Eremiobacteraeota bacterium]|nr:helix-turn-helix transcriptional regulator [Candidatus Eremiobacteraeota bacterium]
METDLSVFVEPALLILISLADRPKHGYSIMQDVQEMTGWAMRPGTLYGALGRMGRVGWIEETKSEDYRRRPYALTSDGQAELARQLAILNTLAQTGLKRSKKLSKTRRILSQ